MTTPTLRLYQSRLLEKIDIERRLQKKMNDVNKFNKSIKNIKENITNFKVKNYKSKMKCKNYKTPRSKL